MGMLTVLISLFSKIPLGGGKGVLITALVEFVNQQAGGLSGLVQLFNKAGVGDIVASWIGKGKNDAIDSPTLQKVLGTAAVDALAQKAGISGDRVTGLSAKILPTMVDKATPDGELPSDGKLVAAQLLTGSGAVLTRLFGKGC
jgi:uncharacterized protein YidB (DUF937 family)